MEHFFQYSLESAICLAVLLLPYLVWFRKNTFHQLNRFYLLGTLLFSLSAPLVNIEIAMEIAPMPKLTKDLSLFEEVPQVKEQVPMEESLPSDEITAYKQPSDEKAAAIEKGTTWSLSEILTAIYFLGFSLFAGMFLYRLSRLFLLIRRRRKTRHAAFTIVQLSGRQVFSFFHFVFVDASRYGEKELKTLLSHEQVHIQQLHSLDVLALEILQAVFWFNPLYRIYRKLLQQEHEYFVDATTSKEIGQPQYAQLLLSLATTKQPVLGHAFAYIPIKHRIFKLFQQPSTTMEKSRFFIALPIVLSLFLVFSCSFDELEGISGNSVPMGNKVRSVQAYFVDERSALKQETDMGSMKFNENGTIADLEIKKHPVFGEIIPHTYTKKNNVYKPTKEFYNSLPRDNSITTDFFAKQAKWFLMSDIAIGTKAIFYISQYNNGSLIFDLERHFAEKHDNVELTENGFDLNQHKFTIKGERSIYREKSTIEKSVDITNDGRLKAIIGHEITEFPTYEYSGSNGISLQRHESQRSTEMHYSGDGLLTKIKKSYSANLEFNNGERMTGDQGLPQLTFQLFYDDRSNISEVEIFNDRDMFLRKYRFHYNEAGYCTKKECINREGSVEFSVRFEYEFFE